MVNYLFVLKIIKTMAIKIEVNGVPFLPKDDTKETHGFKISDDTGVVWSDETNNVIFFRFTEDPKKHDLVTSLQITKGQKISTEIAIIKNGIDSMADIIIRNK